MSARSDRQRKYFADARTVVTTRMRHALNNPTLDTEDIHALLEIEYCKEVASAMFLGGAFGQCESIPLEQFIAQHKECEEESENLKLEITRLQEQVADLGRKLGGTSKKS